MRAKPRMAAALGAAAITAAVVTGCGYEKVADSGQQLNTIGDIAVDTQWCSYGDPVNNPPLLNAKTAGAIKAANAAAGRAYVRRLSEHHVRLIAVPAAHNKVRGAQAPSQPACSPLVSNPIIGIGLSVKASKSRSARPAALVMNFTPVPEQFLVAYRIPEGSTAPQTLPPSPVTDDQGNPVTMPVTDNNGNTTNQPIVLNFKSSQSYSDELNNDPNVQGYGETGQKWVGYITDTVYMPATVTDEWHTKPTFTLPNAGKPYQGPFNYQSILGDRLGVDPTKDTPPDPANPPTADDLGPVYCTPTEATAHGGVAAACDLQSKESFDPSTQNVTVTPGPNENLTDIPVVTRDLGVFAGQGPSVQQGQQGTIPFDMKFAGAGGVTFNLSALTNAPGVTINQPGPFTPGPDSDNQQNVGINVPAGTPPGTYVVTLTATPQGASPNQAGSKVRGAAASQTPVPSRSDNVTFTVTAAPVIPQAPVIADQPITPPAVLGLTLKASPHRVYQGASATWTLAVRNVSSTPASNVKVCEAFPAYAQFIASDYRMAFQGRTMCFSLTSLAGGATRKVHIRMHVNSNAALGTVTSRAYGAASNAASVKAQAGLRVLARPAVVHTAPVTG